MPKRPYFPFYAADWRGNSKLRGAALAERAVWLELMCLFHDSDEYGLLRWELTRLADAIPCHVGLLHSLIQQGILKGVDKGGMFAGFNHTDRKGVDHRLVPPSTGPIWYSSRMVVDEHVRLLQSKGGVKGYNLKVDQKVLPQGDSVSVSGIDISSEKEKGREIAPTAAPPFPDTRATFPPDDGRGPRFTEAHVRTILAAYPRKVAMRAANQAVEYALTDIANRDNPPANPFEWLLGRVQRFAKSRAGNAGNMTAYPATWFRDGRYDDDPTEWDKGGSDKELEAAEKARAAAARSSAIDKASIERKKKELADIAATEPGVFRDLAKLVKIERAKRVVAAPPTSLGEIVLEVKP